jgi:predicted nucleic acid-binding protein
VKRVFADTHFFIALLNARDEAHARALRVESGPRLHLVTTRWVLAEVADAMAAPAYRTRAAKFLTLAKANPWLTILDATDALFEQGCELYGQRPDKDWSLTDCISFIAMANEGLTEALTGDRHFEQAGFKALLA